MLKKLLHMPLVVVLGLTGVTATAQAASADDCRVYQYKVEERIGVYDWVGTGWSSYPLMKRVGVANEGYYVHTRWPVTNPADVVGIHHGSSQLMSVHHIYNRSKTQITWRYPNPGTGPYSNGATKYVSKKNLDYVTCWGQASSWP